jgi:hypothetical protein
MGSFLCPRSCMRVQNLPIWVSIVRCDVICSFLSWPPQVKWGESKEDFHCSCRSCSHCSCNSHAGNPLQLAKFCLACFEFNFGPLCTGRIGNYGSYHCGVYPIYHIWFQSPSFSKCASACPEGLVGLINDLIQLIFPCQSIVYSNPKVTG